MDNPIRFWMRILEQFCMLLTSTKRFCLVSLQAGCVREVGSDARLRVDRPDPAWFSSLVHRVAVPLPSIRRTVLVL